MEVPISQLPPGDTRLVDAIVNQLKSRGIFDKFRKECLSDVDTKPAFQNLRQRVDGHVKKFLGTKTWKNDMNKNQLRDGVRKDIQESGILDAGIDAIINQVVNPKITPLILPYVEDTVYASLQIEKPKREPEDDHKYGENQASVHHHQMQYTQNPIPYHGLPPHLQKNVYSDPSEDGTPKMKLEPKIPQPIEVKKEETKEVKAASEVLPMATDVISSEEDETLLYSNGNEAARVSDAVHKWEDIPDVKMEEDNAVDSFDSAWKDAEKISNAVDKLSLLEAENSVSKSDNANIPRDQSAVFNQQSLDSISSNSSLLSLSPVSAGNRGTASTDKTDDSPKGDLSPDELRSSQSTPLEDEKSASSSEYGHWSGSALPKDLPTADRITIASFTDIGGSVADNSAMVVSGASPVSAESQSSLGSSPSKNTTEESSLDSVPRQKLGLDEVSTSTSTSTSRPSTPRERESNNKKRHSSKSSGTDSKSRSSSSRHHDSKRKDSKHHKDRHASRSKDDHSSHRKKDKYRRDRDDDSDPESRRSRSRHHGGHSSHHSSSHHDSKDRRDKSSSHSSSHKSDRHSKNYRSSHHRSRHSTDKSSKGDSKESKSSSDIKNKSKSTHSSSNDKVTSLKINGSSSTVSDSIKELLPKKSVSSNQPDNTCVTDSRISQGLKLKRNGSFTDACKKLTNGTKETQKSVLSKTSDNTKCVTPVPKKLRAVEDDITLMGNLNKKKIIVPHKKLREPNNNIKPEVMDKKESLADKVIVSPETKDVKTEYKNGKKLKPNCDKQTAIKIVPNSANNKFVSKFKNGKKLKVNPVPEQISNGPWTIKKQIVNNDLTEASPTKPLVEAKQSLNSAKKPVVKNGPTTTPKIAKVANGLTAASLKRKLRVSLENISPSMPAAREKRRKLEKDVVVPPSNSQRLVICSFNAQAKVLKQVMLDDSDDDSDFEGFEPPPKRCADNCDMFSEPENIVFDFEGFPDSPPTPNNKVRNYLARMNRTGNCSRD